MLRLGARLRQAELPAIAWSKRRRLQGYENLIRLEYREPGEPVSPVPGDPTPLFASRTRLRLRRSQLRPSSRSRSKKRQIIHRMKAFTRLLL